MDTSLLLTASLGLIIIYLIFSFGRKKANYWKDIGVPHTKPVPFLGIVYDLLIRKKTFPEKLCELYNEFSGEKFGGFHTLMVPTIMIREPELINQILIKDFAHFQDRFYVSGEHELNNCSMPHLCGDKWRSLRYKLTPTFTSGKLKMMFGEIKKCCDDFVNYLKNKKEQPIDIRTDLFKVVLNIIGTIAFGINVNAFNDTNEEENEFVINSKHFFKPSSTFHIKFLLWNTIPNLVNFMKMRLTDEHVDVFFPKLVLDIINYRESTGTRRNDFLQLMLDEKLKELESTNRKNDNNSTVHESLDENVGDEPEDKELLDHLKSIKYDRSNNEPIFTNRSIAAQTFTFVSGGSETIAAVMSFCFYHLAVEQDVQTQLQQEIDDVLWAQQHDYQSLRKMIYLDQVIYEVLRLHPPGSFINRICLQDYKIPDTNIIITKGMSVNIPVMSLHMDPQYFQDPEKFNPDRFENMHSIPKNVYFPFGAGPRICIAMRLAMLEMKIVLSTVLRSYNLVLSPKTKEPLQLVKSSILQHVEGGIWIQFQERKIS